MIIFVSGKPREGKTVLVSIVALLFADCGGLVHANYFLDSPNAEVIEPYDLVRLLMGERCEPAQMLVFQEWDKWLSSHRAFSDVVTFQDTLVFQSGKLNYHLVGDSQLTMRLGNSVRELADIRYEAEKISFCGQERCSGSVCVRFCDCCFRYYELDTDCPNEDVRTGSFLMFRFLWLRCFGVVFGLMIVLILLSCVLWFLRWRSWSRS